jgi:hypothetical protein
LWKVDFFRGGSSKIILALVPNRTLSKFQCAILAEIHKTIDAHLGRKDISEAMYYKEIHLVLFHIITMSFVYS